MIGFESGRRQWWTLFIKGSLKHLVDWTCCQVKLIKKNNNTCISILPCAKMATQYNFYNFFKSTQFVSSIKINYFFKKNVFILIYFQAFLDKQAIQTINSSLFLFFLHHCCCCCCCWFFLFFFKYLIINRLTCTHAIFFIFKQLSVGC